MDSRLRNNEDLETLRLYRCHPCPIIYELNDYLQGRGINGIDDKFVINSINICGECNPSEKGAHSIIIKELNEDSRPKSILNKVFLENLTKTLKEYEEILNKLIESKLILEQ